MVAAAQSCWSPAATSLSWGRDALAAAILGHTSQLLLRSLARQTAHLGTGPAIASGLGRAATLPERHGPAWRAVTHAWDTVTTGASSVISPATAELADLVQWIGRLTYHNSHWTPARAEASPVRNPARLAAIHHAADASVQIACHDREAVRRAAASQWPAPQPSTRPPTS